MSPSLNQAASDEGGDMSLGDGVDMETFNQILEMDEPDDTEFSHSIVFGFFEQAAETFVSMDNALDERNLVTLSELGHFLKGSSATLGLVKVRDGCEKIQRYGKNENEDGSSEPDSDLCLKRISEALVAVRADYEDVEKALRNFYDRLENRNAD